jgi:predicted RNase H-like nuclease (RuvC/YqgF family)
MTEDERNLDLMVAELGTENRMMRERNERLQRELNAVQADRDGLKEALERILEVSRVALWDGTSKGIGELGPQTRRNRECND